MDEVTSTLYYAAPTTYNSSSSQCTEASKEGVRRMAWTKPEFEVVAVTLEVTAYAGKK